jgi:hypothetical protein
MSEFLTKVARLIAMPHTRREANEIAPMVHVGTLESGKRAIRNPFYDRPKPECHLKSAI